MISVFLVDDHEVVCEGLRGLVDGEPDLRVVGQAGTAAEALQRIAEVSPDVVLLDLNLPDGSGIDVCRTLGTTLPAARVVILTSVSEDEALLAAIVAGAAGYVLKHVRSGELLDTIRRAAADEPLLDQRTRQHVLDRLQHPVRITGEGVAGLSSQEERVFRFLADGLTNRAIGEELGLAEKTVKNYVSNVLTKLGVARRTEATVLAARLAERSRGRPRAEGGDAIRY